MIAQLNGTLTHKSPEQLIVDVGGVGYQVFVSLQSFCQLPDVGGQVRLLIHTNLRENALELFGFADATERQLFALLNSVSGIGPRLALNILSGMPARELRMAIESGDLVRLVSIPGIGKKTAERVVVELRDKMKSLPTEPDVAGPPRANGLDAEAVSALVNLGYRRPDAEHAVKATRAAGDEDLESIIRGALKRLSA
ncbi:MAG TPA: Holliday junction branch migration protein RuvA [Candidatus Kryptonia bacterium]|nr:Holliday junction branch migration protein RuvA [Candidatus Kryptonia bacterium]